MKLLNLLKQQATINWLFYSNVIVSGLIFFLFRDQHGGDALTYLGLADGILEGNYSYWYFASDYYPDTFRNPGYALFLTTIRFFTKSVIVIQVIQFVLYLLSIRMAMFLLKSYTHRNEIVSMFLLLMLPSIYVASYTTSVFPEILVTALILFCFYLDDKWKRESIWKFVSLGLLYGIIFQIRPVFLFVPLILSLYTLKCDRTRQSLIQSVVALSVFFVTMIPYGLWNQKHHGVFKVTSIEGGGGVFHLGYWSFKLPDYYVTHYWNNYCTEEMIPMIDSQEKEENVKQFNAEWEEIEALCSPYFSKKDSAMMALQAQHPALFPTYESAYTLHREQLLKEYTIRHIKSDFGFYVKAKTYGAFRLWVTGIPMKDFRNAGFIKKIYLMYPFLITLATFLAAIILIPMAFRRYKFSLKSFVPMLLVIVYFGLIHIPFTIQSRYTIPVRIELLMILAASIYYLFLNPRVKD